MAGFTTVSTLNSDQNDVSKQLSPYFQNTLNQGPGAFSYNGQLTAPIGQGEQDVVDNSSRLNAIANNTYGQIGNYDPQSVNQQFNTNVQQPTLQSWQNDVAPYLSENLPAFSSTRANVTARSLQDLESNLSTQRMGYQQQAQVNALNALQGGSTYNQNAANIAAIPREIQQAGLDKSYTNFLNSNQSYQNSVNSMLQYLGIQTQAIQPQSSPFQQALAGVQTVANVVGAVKGNPGTQASTQQPLTYGSDNVAPAGAPDAGTQLPDYSNLQPTGY